MVQAIVDVTSHTNAVLNVVKAKYGLQNKSEVINLVVMQYEEELLDPSLRPEYVERLKGREKEKSLHVEDFARRYGLKNVPA